MMEPIPEKRLRTAESSGAGWLGLLPDVRYQCRFSRSERTSCGFSNLNRRTHLSVCADRCSLFLPGL